MIRRREDKGSEESARLLGRPEKAQGLQEGDRTYDAWFRGTVFSNLGERS